MGEGGTKRVINAIDIGMLETESKTCLNSFAFIAYYLQAFSVSQCQVHCVASCIFLERLVHFTYSLCPLAVTVE